MLDKLDELIKLSNQKSISNNMEYYEKELHTLMLNIKEEDINNNINDILTKLDYLSSKGLKLYNNYSPDNYLSYEKTLSYSSYMQVYLSYINPHKENSILNKVFASYINLTSAVYTTKKEKTEKLNENFILLFNKLEEMGSDFSLKKNIFVNNFLNDNLNYLNNNKTLLPFFDYLIKNYDDGLLNYNNVKDNYYNKKYNFTYLLLTNSYSNNDKLPIAMYTYLEKIVKNINIKKSLANVKKSDNYVETELIKYLDTLNSANKEKTFLKSMKFKKKKTEEVQEPIKKRHKI